MYWRNWFKPWFASAIACIVIMGGCGAFIQYRLSTTEQDVLPDEVVNQARIEISGIMLVLEQHHTEVSSQNRIREELRKWSEEKQLHLQYTGLDGTILFDSSAPHSMNKDKLNLKSDLHYDLYSSKTAHEMFKLAFPVVDPESGVQAGNAIFTLPGSLLAYRQTTSFPAMFTLLMIALLLVLLLLFRLRYKINHDLLHPVNGLKDHAEAILKGNYGQKAEYAKQDEIGEVYAVFDQMRSEIMTLSMQKEAQSKAQKELISNISHDLKTPLTIVKAYIEAIREGVCSDLPAVMAYMEIMQAQANKMAMLVEDLLVHALRDLDQISVHPVEHYSKEIFESILRPIGPYIRTAGVEFTEPSEIPNVLIRIDPVRIEQLLSNLIANALKHTSAGDTIRVAIVQEQHQLTVTVSDTGEGILPQDMPFIFERYFQGHAPSQFEKRFNEGSGLGLSICKHIIEAHQGTISFKSAKHQGTEFYFTLPIC
ncbi:HAMP domain-containing sensor histidine kinase [Paenibacillus sp. IHBB 3054]|uniref:HAMP domain-containing sensor histidine kinase n=1 Tax=Paenibacillus sp. IHBB 3054 TaxID=3425689 RepID=UPI003F67C555